MSSSLVHASVSNMNSPISQLHISKFEYRLLHYFQEVYLRQHLGTQSPQLEHIWHVEVPKLWQHSDLVRQSIFLLSAMILWNVCDLELMFRADYGYYDGRAHYNGIGRSDFNSVAIGRDLIEEGDEFLSLGRQTHDEIKLLLFEKSTEYFTKCLSRTYDTMDRVRRQDLAVTSMFQAAEIVISGVLLFSFLALEPHGLVPLVSFNPEVTDLLSMCKGMKISMGQSFPLLYVSPYSGLFHDSEYLNPPTITDEDVYPLVECLKLALEEYIRCNNLMETSQMTISYREAIRVFEIVIHLSVKGKYALPIFRYIFLIDIEIYDYIRLNRDEFGLKLLFFYCCMGCMTKFRLFTDSNIWIEYVTWYKKHNFKTHGDWKYPEDKSLYGLVVEKRLEVKDDDFSVLQTFNPMTFEDFEEMALD